MSEANSPSELPSFETALTELQRIVVDLEDGRVGLEESLVRFERGIGLLKTCYQVLERAEQRIEQLVGMKSDGTPLTTPFDATATAVAEDPTASRRRSRKTKAEPIPELPVLDNNSESDSGFLF